MVLVLKESSPCPSRNSFPLFIEAVPQFLAEGCVVAFPNLVAPIAGDLIFLAFRSFYPYPKSLSDAPLLGFWRSTCLGASKNSSPLATFCYICYTLQIYFSLPYLYLETSLEKTFLRNSRLLRNSPLSRYLMFMSVNWYFWTACVFLRSGHNF